MSIIDATYFVAELNIANTEQPGVEEKLNTFIAKYERKFLNSLLGRDFATLFVAGIAVLPTPEERWTDLLNELRDATTKESPIANYVYYWYLRDQATLTAGIAVVKPKSENSTLASGVDKSVRAWNEMVEEVWRLKRWLYDNREDYPEYSEDQWFYILNHQEVFYPYASMLVIDPIYACINSLGI